MLQTPDQPKLKTPACGGAGEGRDPSMPGAALAQRPHRWRDFTRNMDLRSWGIAAFVLGAFTAAWFLYPHARPSAGARATTEIVYWTSPDPEVADGMKPVVEEFERRNPQYHVVVGNVTARNGDDNPTRFLLGVAGGVPPDLIFFDRFAIVEWASRGAFTDLTPFIRRDQDRPDAIREENFFEPAWREPIYRGNIYAVSNGADTRALYYSGDPLIRAGFVYQPTDPEVMQGKAQPGEARPPRTWEELCLKRLHAEGRVADDGTVELRDWLRRPAVNENVPAGAAIDLNAAGVRAGDVVALLNGSNVFRGRVKEILAPARFKIDLARDQRPDLGAIPSAFRGPCEVKLYDQDSYVNRLTRFDPKTGQMSAIAFIPLSFGGSPYGDSWLYHWGWLNGAEFMNPGGTECQLDHQPIIAALQWLTDCYDAMGGVEAASVFQASASSGGLDPFLTGKIALRVDHDGFMGVIMAFKPDFNFGVAPSPIPEARLKAGFKSFGWGGGWSYAIPSSARNKEAAWTLLRWLTSLEANQMMAESQASLKRAKGQPFFPRLQPDRRVMAWIQDKYVTHNPSVSPRLVKAYQQFVDLLPGSRYRPVTPVGQKLWNEHIRATVAAINHLKRPYEALNYGKRQVQASLDQFLHPPTGPLVPWRLVMAVYLGVVVVIFAGLTFVQERRRRLYGGGRRAWFEGFLCASPWLLGLLVFGAGPIVFSIIISFCHYDVLNPARFIGLKNYANLIGTHFDPVVKQMVWNDPLFWKSLSNTLFMVIGVPLGIILGLALALLLDAKVRGLHVYRTIYYLPAIIPAVAGFILWLWIFDPSRGLLNQALMVFGVHNPPNWLQDPAWAKPALILMGLWGVGGSMIIWLAGLKDIPESMYEAAALDGANRVQSFMHVTIPLLTPYIFFNVIMGLIGVFQTFEAAFIMTDGGPADSTLFFAYKLFNEAFRYLNMGAASAMAWILFVVVMAITLLQLWLSKKWVHYGG